MTLQEERDALLEMMKRMVTPTGWQHLVEAHNLIVAIDPSFGERAESTTIDVGGAEMEIEG